jgi:hypothetical protein
MMSLDQMTEKTKAIRLLASHASSCSVCNRAATMREACPRGRKLNDLIQSGGGAGAMDQRSVDQRTGRTYAEIESTKKDIAAEAAANRSALWLGAWLALCWVLDDDVSPLPLRDRLRNAGQIP